MAKRLSSEAVTPEDIALLLGGFAGALGNALEEVGALSRGRLADHLESWADRNPNTSGELMRPVISGLRKARGGSPLH